MTERRSSPVWHPFTQHALLGEVPEIASALGATLVTTDGRRIIDAISSWWVITHGHRHPRIMEAIREQSGKLDQVIFASMTHAPAEALARRLIDIAPAGLAHVFYSDSGSTAVEVAMKMALGYWRNTGAPRTRIAALEHGYHGDTIGTMSAGARGVFTGAYEPLLFDVERIPFPVQGQEQVTIDAFEAACRASPVAALVIEPLILGAGGMRMYAPHVLKNLREICDRFGVLLIVDEVMTGFGRTGTLFACEQAGIAPDILCLAKGLTGGALPLAATLCTPAIFEAHFSADRSRTFFHSSSYTANPIACAAALANLDVWRDEPVLAAIERLATLQREMLSDFRSAPGFGNVRQLGTITAVDVVVPDGGYLAAIGPELYSGFLARDMLLRPLGNTIYVMPPYCIGEAELAQVYQTLYETVMELQAGAGRARR